MREHLRANQLPRLRRAVRVRMRQRRVDSDGGRMQQERRLQHQVQNLQLRQSSRLRSKLHVHGHAAGTGRPSQPVDSVPCASPQGLHRQAHHSGRDALLWTGKHLRGASESDPHSHRHSRRRTQLGCRRIHVQPGRRRSRRWLVQRVAAGIADQVHSRHDGSGPELGLRKRRQLLRLLQILHTPGIHQQHDARAVHLLPRRVWYIWSLPVHGRVAVGSLFRRAACRPEFLPGPISIQHSLSDTQRHMRLSIEQERLLHARPLQDDNQQLRHSHLRGNMDHRLRGRHIQPVLRLRPRDVLPRKHVVPAKHHLQGWHRYRLGLRRRLHRGSGRGTVPVGDRILDADAGLPGGVHMPRRHPISGGPVRRHSRGDMPRTSSCADMRRKPVRLHVGASGLRPRHASALRDHHIQVQAGQHQRKGKLGGYPDVHGPRMHRQMRDQQLRRGRRRLRHLVRRLYAGPRHRRDNLQRPLRLLAGSASGSMGGVRTMP